MLKYILTSDNIDDIRYLYTMIFSMEQNAITGILDIETDEELNRLFNNKIKGIEEKKRILSEHTTYHYHKHNFSIVKISNTFILYIINLLYPKKELTGGSKKNIYRSKRWKIYYLYKNGKKIKKYI